MNDQQFKEYKIEQSKAVISYFNRLIAEGAEPTENSLVNFLMSLMLYCDDLNFNNAFIKARKEIDDEN